MPFHMWFVHPFISPVLFLTNSKNDFLFASSSPIMDVRITVQFGSPTDLLTP